MTRRNGCDPRIAKARQAVAEQRKWIERCGGSLGGYIMNYGSAEDEVHSGDGGEAIWAADKKELDELEARLAALLPRKDNA